MKKIHVVFNPHKPAPYKYGSRRVAIDAALASEFVPTAQEAIEAIRASKETAHLRFQNPQKILVQPCDKMSQLAAKMYAGFGKESTSNPHAYLEMVTLFKPIKIWILCAIHRGIKLGIL